MFGLSKDMVPFMSRFLLSFLGYGDGYTDAVSMMIAGSCSADFAQKLAFWMKCSYFIGVVFLQWIVMAVMVQFDPSQACLMKLLHMDALATSVSIQKEKKWMWSYVNAARTVFEDLPQAVFQTLFLIKVRQNYFLVLSVAVSAGSSIKVHEAIPIYIYIYIYIQTYIHIYVYIYIYIERERERSTPIEY